MEKSEEKQTNYSKLDPKQLSKSPLAIALTEVLLADGGEHLRRHPEVFPNLYLPYLNLQLPGLEKKVLQLFKNIDCGGINLEKSYLVDVDLNDGELKNSKLNNANLLGAKLNGAILNGAELKGAVLIGAELNSVHLNSAKLNGANLYCADLFNIEMNNRTSWLGALFDTVNIQEIGAYLDEESLTWVIQAPKHIEAFADVVFRFERDGFVFTYKLPSSLTMGTLKKLNPSWTISLVDESSESILF